MDRRITWVIVFVEMLVRFAMLSIKSMEIVLLAFKGIVCSMMAHASKLWVDSVISSKNARIGSTSEMILVYRSVHFAMDMISRQACVLVAANLKSISCLMANVLTSGLIAWADQGLTSRMVNAKMSVPPAISMTLTMEDVLVVEITPFWIRFEGYADILNHVANDNIN